MLLVLGPGLARAEKPSSRVLHVAYFNPAGRKPLPAFHERIDRIVADVQEFYREEMERNGYGPLTFGLDRAADGKVVIHIAQSDKTFSKTAGPEGREVRETVRAVLAARGIDMNREHALVFQNCIWEEGGHRITPSAPYSGSGDHLQGLALVTDYKILDPLNFTNHTGYVIDRGQRQSTSRYNVIQIGGVAHELGHSFGLPHNKEQPGDNMRFGTALMGAGNYTYRQERAGARKGSFITAAHALALATHPLFRRSDEDRDVSPATNLEMLSFRQVKEGLVMTARASGRPEVFGAVVYNDPMPTGVNRDYDALSWGARPDARRLLSFPIGRPRPGHYHMSLWLYHVNGAKQPFHFVYRVGRDGRVPTDTLKRHVHLIKAEAAWRANDRPGMDAALAALAGRRDDVLRRARIFDRRLRRWEDLRAPRSVPHSETTLSLSSLRWSAANVAWLWPSYDKIEWDDAGQGPPLESGQRRHAHGLYAHAPSKYVFELGGRWKTLEGSCGLQKGNPGSVVFVVRGDGRERYRSPPVADSAECIFSADVSGVRTLELVVEDAGDGNSSDWGVWFDPLLKR
jgi:hypothetical protein